MFDSSDPIDCNLPDLLCPWDFPGKNTGVGCHFLLQEMADLPDPEIEPASPESTALQAGSLLAKPLGKPLSLGTQGNILVKWPKRQ